MFFLFRNSVVCSLFSTGKLADNGIESQFRPDDTLLKLEQSDNVSGFANLARSSGLSDHPGSKQSDDRTPLRLNKYNRFERHSTEDRPIVDSKPFLMISPK